MKQYCFVIHILNDVGKEIRRRRPSHRRASRASVPARSTRGTRVRDLLVAHHHGHRASPAKPRGGLFDDEPSDADDARKAGADAVEAARRGGDNAALDALCAKAGRYLDLSR